MLPSTMISLRNIKKPISVSAAILPNYELYFPFPSAACVKSIKISNKPFDYTVEIKKPTEKHIHNKYKLYWGGIVCLILASGFNTR